MQTLKKILYLLTPSERKHAFFLLLMILIMALIDVIGVASILPFMAVLSNPEIIETSRIINYIFKFSSIFGVENNQQFLFILGIIVFGFLLISLAFKAVTTYSQVRFNYMREYSIGKRLVEGYLNQPYDWFLNHHSADLGKNILSEASQIVGNGIAPLINLIASGIVTVALIALLIITEPELSLIVTFSLSMAYGLTYYFSKNYLKKIGDQRLKNNQLRFSAVIEAFSASKEVKIGGLEQNFINRFSIPAQIFAQNQASATVIRQIPRFILEAIAFGGIILVILYLMVKKGSFNEALPIITLYAFAGYRLMPALQQIYGSLTQLSFVGPSLEKLYEDLKKLKKFEIKNDHDSLSFNKKISLKNVNYNYPNSTRITLEDINIDIPVKNTVGLIGATGSGKTTTVDIILGLLKPQNGKLEIDGQIITDQNMRAWQRSIGYVPQQIYLSDDTVAANIAFGVNTKDINYEAIEKASKIANLHDFIMEELPRKYSTTIGERGVRLSGGQRQRIGIARALYHDPKVLILDEATSALDNLTEQAVMDAINNLGKKITIILIAHRLTTVKNCNTIFLLDRGKIKASGTFEEIIQNYDQYKHTNIFLEQKN